MKKQVFFVRRINRNYQTIFDDYYQSFGYQILSKKNWNCSEIMLELTIKRELLDDSRIKQLNNYFDTKYQTLVKLRKKTRHKPIIKSLILAIIPIILYCLIIYSKVTSNEGLLLLTIISFLSSSGLVVTHYYYQSKKETQKLSYQIDVIKNQLNQICINAKNIINKIKIKGEIKK